MTTTHTQIPGAGASPADTSSPGGTARSPGAFGRPVSFLADCYRCADEGYSLTCEVCDGVGLRAYCAWCDCHLSRDYGCECGAFPRPTAEDAIVRALGPVIGWARAQEDARDIMQGLMCEAPEDYADFVRDADRLPLPSRLSFHRETIADALDQWWEREDGTEEVVRAWHARRAA